MPRRRTPEAQTLHDYGEALDVRLREMRDDVLARAATYCNGVVPTVDSFHGQIGGKNNVLVDSIRTQFLSPADFIARWFQGLVQVATADAAEGRYYRASVRLARLMQDEL